jgi:hypothetical protein
MADDQTSYLQQIAAYRQERAQREMAVQLEDLKFQHEQARQERDLAAQRGDRDTFELHDETCEMIEQEYNRICPPQAPAPHPAAVEFIRKNQPFLERHGQAAVNAIGLAHQYATRPRVPHANNPGLTGMGLAPNSPQCFEAMRSLLEMYGKDYGVRYDRNEELLDPTTAAKVSGVSADNYNAALKTLHAQGRLGKDNK